MVYMTFQDLDVEVANDIEWNFTMRVHIRHLPIDYMA
jgi:hypothetical protein